MEDDLFGVVAEVHIMELDVPFQLGVDRLAVFIHLFPRPGAGGLVCLGHAAIGGVLGMDQRDGALVGLRLLVQQRKDALAARQCHDDGVDLHGDLVDGHVEAFVVGQEAGQLAQRQTGGAGQRQHAAHHGAQHVGQVTQLGVAGAVQIGEQVGPVGALKQAVVQLVEFRDGLFLVAEHLDHLLAGHHFLNVAVHRAQIALLGHKVLAGVGGEVFGDHQHDAHHDEGDQCQRPGQGNHQRRGADNGDKAVDELRDGLGDHLAQRVGVVGVHRHNIAVGVAVKVADGQRLHVGEQLVPQVFQGALRDVRHQPGLREGRCHAQRVEAGHPQNGCQQAGKVGAAGAEHGQNVAVDEGLHEPCALQIAQHAGKNAKDHNGALYLIIL